MQTLAEASHQQAASLTDEIAFVFEGSSSTFGQFDQNSNKVANGLQQESVLPQSRVAYLGKDSISAYEVLFGCAKAKAVFVPINWRLAAKEVLFLLNDSEAEILFIGEEFLPMIEQIDHKLISVKKIISMEGNHPRWTVYEQWRSSQSKMTPDLTYQPEDVVIQMYTSGTTGHPKGVQLANYSLFRVMQGMRAQGDKWMGLNSQDTLLLSLPIFHIGGLWWAVQGFLVGGKGIIVKTFNTREILASIEKYGITKVLMVPAMIQFSLAEPSCNKTDLSSVQGFLYGGSPITPDLLQKAMELFDCDFFQIYGMTETGNMAVCLRPEDHIPVENEKRKSVGKPLPGVEVKVIDQQGNALPVGQVGEICLRSPANMLGYWKREEDTTKTLVDGWVHTGDAGYMDEERYIYICDRIKDMIIYAGENLYPAEIEAAINDHPAVVAAAVIGIPDERWGELVKAFVVSKDGASLRKLDLINFLKGRIAEFKIPKSVSFVDALPRNPSGKILKTKLRAPFWEGRERLVN